MRYHRSVKTHFGIRAVAVCILPLLAACNQPISEEPASVADIPIEDGLILSDEEIANLGIATVPAEMAEYAPEVQGFGTVVPFGEIAQSDADIATAQAAVTQTDAARDRARALYEGIGALSRESLDLAERDATASEAQLALAKRSAAAKFGRDAPWLNPQRQANILGRLTSGRAVVIHGTFPLGVFGGVFPKRLTFSHLDQSADGHVWESDEIWEGPADTSVPGRSVFALVDGSDLAESERILIGAPGGAPETGIRIPPDAVLISEGAAWFFVREPGGAFTRHALDLSKAMPGGYFAGNEIAPGELIVTNGASLLLARELNPSTEVED
jgi:hypothetical protein